MINQWKTDKLLATSLSYFGTECTGRAKIWQMVAKTNFSLHCICNTIAHNILPKQIKIKLFKNSYFCLNWIYKNTEHFCILAFVKSTTHNQTTRPAQRKFVFVEVCVILLCSNIHVNKLMQFFPSMYGPKLLFCTGFRHTFLVCALCFCLLCHNWPFGFFRSLGKEAQGEGLSHFIRTV